MIEPVRMLADALADPTHGVAAQLAALVDGEFVEDGDTVPTTVTVIDETRDPEAAIGRPSADSTEPCVRVFLIGIDTMDAQAVALAREYLVTMGVVIDAVGDRAELNVQESGYLTRAVLRTVVWFFRDAADAQRQRHGIQFIGATSASLAHFHVSPTSDRASVGVKVQAQFRDALPD